MKKFLVAVLLVLLFFVSASASAQVKEYKDRIDSPHAGGLGYVPAKELVPYVPKNQREENTLYESVLIAELTNGEKFLVMYGDAINITKDTMTIPHRYYTYPKIKYSIVGGQGRVQIPKESERVYLPSDVNLPDSTYVMSGNMMVENQVQQQKNISVVRSGRIALIREWLTLKEKFANQPMGWFAKKGTRSVLVRKRKK